ncbi:MAG TPA: winged helix-turn-helix domain-containing protein [Bauldia sp.]|nr:winged helix-turn-helix domain-containing protein [Bauldia sp.]
MAARRFAFGAFLLDEHSTLLRDGAPVALSARAIALLRALLQAEGEPVTKAALMDAAWPGASVEESNLTVQIAALRKVLGASDSNEDWIATVPRLGYRLMRAPAQVAAAAPSAPADAKPAVAVLPFTNMSSDPEQEFFADGLAEDLITDLARVPGLLVIARNSSFTYKGRSVNLRTAAAELGVRYIVEGSVRRAASRVRVSAQLIDTVDNRHMWVDRFDRDIADVFALQDEIVGRIVNALGDVLPGMGPVSSRRATNLEAYDLTVRGRQLVTQTPEGNRTGRQLLQRAIELDPEFAEPHAWLALSHVWGWAFWGEDMGAQAVLARKAAERAIALDPQGTDARWVLGYVKAYTGDLAAGIAEFETTLRHNPNNADARVMLGELKVHAGRAVEGIEILDHALRLNPFPGSAYYWSRGWAEYGARRYGDAVQTLRNEPVRRTAAQRILAAALGQLGRLDEGRAEAAAFLAANSHFTISQWAKAQPFASEADRQHYVDGYLKVGLPL